MKEIIKSEKEGFLRHYNRMDKRQGMQVGRVTAYMDSADAESVK